MKKLGILALSLGLFTTVMAGEPYKFTDQKVISSSSVKDQLRSGTCWSFSGIGQVESEAMKGGQSEMDISEMWIVRNAYFERAVRYVRMHGKASIGGGGATGDVITIIKKYGAVPEETYPGLNYGTSGHVHGELDAVIEGYMNSVLRNENRKLSTAWQAGLNGILDAYFGVRPEKFTYKGKEYTPKSYAASLGVNFDDIILVTSFTHHPFYEKFVLEVPDNWNADAYYNVPMNEMQQIIDNALEKGYTVNWSADVSERGFKYNEGYAIIPATKIEEMANSEKSKWTERTPEEIKKMSMILDGVTPEMQITQELRQIAYDNWETTDDHGMVIMGYAVDQNGNRFYKVKNSWNTNSVYKGYFYVSVPYVLYKTTGISVNKNGVPKEIAKKLNLK